MQPQSLAMRLLPAETYETLMEYSLKGVLTMCSPNWSPEALAAAWVIGPHTSTLTPDNVELVWEEVLYHVEAGFVNLVLADVLFSGNMPTNLKISRLAVVLQRNHRGQLILNLSAGVELHPKRIPGSRRSAKIVQPSVNETTEPAADEEDVKRLGTATLAALLFQFECPCQWEILWLKIDLSNGFWRMIVQAGQEPNFVYVMPNHQAHPGTWFVVPSSLQMGWTNSLAYFCTTTEATQLLIARILALSLEDRVIAPHIHDSHCTASTLTVWARNSEMDIFLWVFVNDFIQAPAGPRHRP
jgi:hypothetical protein